MCICYLAYQVCEWKSGTAAVKNSKKLRICGWNKQRQSQLSYLYGHGSWSWRWWLGRISCGMLWGAPMYGAHGLLPSPIVYFRIYLQETLSKEFISFLSSGYRGVMLSNESRTRQKHHFTRKTCLDFCPCSKYGSLNWIQPLKREWWILSEKQHEAQGASVTN